MDNTDAQELSLTTNTLGISGGTATVDLSTYLDNTDNQELSLAGSMLSISGGSNTIDLSTFISSDNQNLTSATLSGANLTIAIEGGTAVSVDLSPIVSSLQSNLNDAQNEVVALQTQITDILSRLDAVESCACDNEETKNSGPILYQNIPNPFNGTSSIKYYLPTGITNASIVFSNSIGQIISKIALNETGTKEVNINSDGLASGTYFYTMYVGSKKIDTKKMVIKN